MAFDKGPNHIKPIKRGTKMKGRAQKLLERASVNPRKDREFILQFIEENVYRRGSPTLEDVLHFKLLFNPFYIHCRVYPYSYVFHITTQHCNKKTNNKFPLVRCLRYEKKTKELTHNCKHKFGECPHYDEEWR